MRINSWEKMKMSGRTILCEVRINYAYMLSSLYQAETGECMSLATRHKR